LFKFASTEGNCTRAFTLDPSPAGPPRCLSLCLQVGIGLEESFGLDNLCWVSRRSQIWPPKHPDTVDGATIVAVVRALKAAQSAARLGQRQRRLLLRLILRRWRWRFLRLILSPSRSSQQRACHHHNASEEETAFERDLLSDISFIDSPAC